MKTVEWQQLERQQQGRAVEFIVKLKKSHLFYYFTFG